MIVNYRTIQFNDFFEVVKYIIFSMLIVIVLTICQEKRYYVFLLKIINIMLLVVCIFGIIQYFNPFSINELYIKYYAPTQYETLVNDYPTPRIIGLKSNPSVYGILVSLGVYFNLLYYKYSKRKYLCIISILLCIINLMLTLTRTIQIAFICSIIVYTVIFVLLKKGWKKAILSFLLISLFIFVLLIVLPKQLTWRLIQGLNVSNATSWIGRVSKWQMYVPIIKNNFLFGIGPIKNYVNQLGYIDSELIQNILQYGMAGIIAYITMLLSPIYLYIKNKNKYILKYYIPILIMIIINNIASTTLIQFDTAIGVYIIFGLIFVQNKIKIDEEKIE